MLTVRFLTHIEKQLDRICQSGMTHREKDGALRLVQREVWEYKEDFEREMNEAFKARNRVTYRVIKDDLLEMKSHVSVSSPVAKMIDDQCRYLSEQITINAEELPF